ncbi:MAG TPA: TIR domain-containing protein, partial [Ktedonobacterales bacterium]|nr:TIR domain-containing protein [Ktedonobacterales bacterium]
MAMAVSIFISYSRTNSAFVDRLEADLQARSFQVWVDRRKLEAGQNWMDELQKAIDRCHVLLIALSPEAAESKYVRMEYRYAQAQSKIIIPLEYQTCPRVPIDLNGIQWIDFKAAYEQGLSGLLVALSQITPAPLVPPARPAPFTPPPVVKEPVLVKAQPAPPPPDADLNTLYRMGVAAKAEGDLERAATLWQQVLDRDSDFGHKTLATFMAQLQQELHPFRIQRLKALALQARNVGEWGQEIGAWQALLGLEPQNAEATQAISTAKVNQQHAWMYENAIEFAQQGQPAAVGEQLNMLWQLAPYYGDPAGLREKVGIFPRLKASYVGNVIGTKGSRGAKLEFVSVTQSGGRVKGNFVYGSGSSDFEGVINYTGDFVFMVAKTTHFGAFKFVGKVQSDGHLVGTWENLDSPGAGGTWEAE